MLTPGTPSWLSEYCDTSPGGCISILCRRLLAEAGVRSIDLRFADPVIERLLPSIKLDVLPVFVLPPPPPLALMLPSNEDLVALAVDNRFSLFFLKSDDGCGMLFMGYQALIYIYRFCLHLFIIPQSLRARTNYFNDRDKSLGFPDYPA